MLANGGGFHGAAPCSPCGTRSTRRSPAITSHGGFRGSSGADSTGVEENTQLGASGLASNHSSLSDRLTVDASGIAHAPIQPRLSEWGPCKDPWQSHMAILDKPPTAYRPRGLAWSPNGAGPLLPGKGILETQTGCGWVESRSMFCRDLQTDAAQISGC